MSGPEPTLYAAEPCPGVALDNNSISRVEFQICNGVVVKNPPTAPSSAVVSEDPVTVDEVVGLLRFLKPRNDPNRFFEEAWFLEILAGHIKMSRRDPVSLGDHIAAIRNIEANMCGDLISCRVCGGTVRIRGRRDGKLLVPHKPCDPAKSCD